MKRIVIVLLLICIHCHAQVPDTLKASKLLAYNIGNVFYNDVIKTFGLSSKYDTDLKKKVFMESAEYNKLLDSIIILRSIFLDRTYKLMADVTMPEYNVDNGGFTVVLSDQFIPLNVNKEAYSAAVESYRQNEKEFEGFWFPMVNVFFFDKNRSLLQRVFIGCDESIAVEIEKKNVQFIFMYKITGELIDNYSTEFWGKGTYGHNYYPVTSNVSLIINYKGKEVLTFNY